jgi:hypothetical protein
MLRPPSGGRLGVEPNAMSPVAAKRTVELTSADVVFATRNAAESASAVPLSPALRKHRNAAIVAATNGQRREPPLQLLTLVCAEESTGVGQFSGGRDVPLGTQ